MAKCKYGILYCITNPAFEGQVKVGITTGDLSKRLSNYNVGCPHRAYEIAYAVECDAVVHFEKHIHNELAKKGYKQNYEWFQVDTQTVVSLIKKELPDFVD